MVQQVRDAYASTDERKEEEEVIIQQRK